jgi:hypothetical protein
MSDEILKKVSEWKTVYRNGHDGPVFGPSPHKWKTMMRLTGQNLIDDYENDVVSLLLNTCDNSPSLALQVFLHKSNDCGRSYGDVEGRLWDLLCEHNTSDEDALLLRMVAKWRASMIETCKLGDKEPVYSSNGAAIYPIRWDQMVYRYKVASSSLSICGADPELTMRMLKHPLNGIYRNICTNFFDDRTWVEEYLQHLADLKKITETGDDYSQVVWPSIMSGDIDVCVSIGSLNDSSLDIEEPYRVVGVIGEKFVDEQVIFYADDGNFCNLIDCNDAAIGLIFSEVEERRCRK